MYITWSLIYCSRWSFELHFRLIAPMGWPKAPPSSALRPSSWSGTRPGSVGRWREQVALGGMFAAQLLITVQKSQSFFRRSEPTVFWHAYPNWIGFGEVISFYTALRVPSRVVSSQIAPCLHQLKNSWLRFFDGDVWRQTRLRPVPLQMSLAHTIIPLLSSYVPDIDFLLIFESVVQILTNQVWAGDVWRRTKSGPVSKFRLFQMPLACIECPLPCSLFLKIWVLTWGLLNFRENRPVVQLQA